MTLDTKSLAVIEFLTALKTCQDILQELPVELRPRPQVKHASIGWVSFRGKPYHISLPNGELEKFQHAAQIDVSVHLTSQRAMDWLIEIYWNEVHWLIETEIYVDSDAPHAGMGILRNFPERYAETLDELIVQVKAAARELVENVDAIDEAVALDAAAAMNEVKS